MEGESWSCCIAVLMMGTMGHSEDGFNEQISKTIHKERNLSNCTCFGESTDTSNTIPQKSVSQPHSKNQTCMYLRQGTVGRLFEVC